MNGIESVELKDIIPVPNTSSQREMREGIMKIQEVMVKTPGVMMGDCFPLKHTFAKGLYIREISVPGGTLTVTKIHKYSHAVFLMQGEMSILEEWGIKKIKAPASFITRAGTKRIIYHHTDVILITVHATEETDIGKIEEEIIAKDFDEIDDVIDIQNFISEVGK